ncbi:hypothetical protein RQP46_000671 [Phenoliferia psychrophenolica]
MKGLPSSRPASPTASIYGTPGAKSTRSPLYRWVLGGVVIFCLLRLHPAGVTGLARIGLDELEGLTCEERGLLARASNSSEEASRVAILVRASSLSGDVPNRDNTVLSHPFHPFLSSSHPVLFPGTDIADYDPAPNPLPGSPSSSCIQPIQHALHMLPPPVTANKEPELFFSFCTSPKRVVEFAPLWNHFLGAPSATRAPPGCVVVDAQGQGDVEGRRLANAALIDSDTGFWIDIADLKHTLRQFDSSEDHMLGGFSEAKANFADHGKIAFGGAGIILSRSLVRKMQGLVGTCARKYQHIFGGDGILTNCAALARDMAYQDVVEEIPGLSQMDLRGDASGFLTSGQKLLSLHHWVGWLDLLPNTTGVDAVALFADGADAIGGRNMFRRWVFDGGKTVWTSGFSVMIHRDALTADDLDRVEHSWTGFEPRRKSRGARAEGEDKLTYWITAVERLTPTLTLFRHECRHPSVQNDLRRIDILWDAQGETSWWDIGSRGRRFKTPPKQQRMLDARPKSAASSSESSGTSASATSSVATSTVSEVLPTGTETAASPKDLMAPKSAKRPKSAKAAAKAAKLAQSAAKLQAQVEEAQHHQVPPKATDTEEPATEAAESTDSAESTESMESLESTETPEDAESTARV